MRGLNYEHVTDIIKSFILSIEYLKVDILTYTTLSDKKRFLTKKC